MRKQIFTFLLGLLFISSAFSQRIPHHNATTQDGKFITEINNKNSTQVNQQLKGLDDYLFADDFSSGNLDAWTPMGEGLDNWSVSATDVAGGSSPELHLNWTPQSIGLVILLSPVINTSGYTELPFQFMHTITTWSGAGGVYFQVLTTSDGGSTWNTAWQYDLVDNVQVGPEFISFMISTADIGSENFQFAFVTGDDTDLMDGWYIDNVALGETADLDVGVSALTGVPDLMSIGEDVTASVTVVNYGSETVDFDVNFVVNDGSVDVFTDTKAVTGLANGEQATVTFETWTTSTVGVYTATATSMLTDDANPDNDMVSKDFSVIEGVTRNMVIVEDFTGTWCGFCPGAAMGISDLMANGYNMGPVAYHSGDPYETVEGLSRIDDYYGIEGFPTVIFDGVEGFIGGSATESMYDSYLPLVEARMAIPTPITVELINVAFDGSVFTADVVCEAVSAIASDDLVMHAVLTENHIDEAWVTMYELNEVERLMFNGADGTPIDLINNTTQTVSISFTLDGTWIPQLCDVVVFVQDVSSHEIFNGDKTHVEELTELPDATVTVFDNAGNPIEGATVNLGGVDLPTNASGQAVFANLEPGVYWYEASKDGYLPGSSMHTVMQVENKALETTIYAGNILAMEDFDDDFPPPGWSMEGDQVDNWSQSMTNYAGGSTPELQFSWSPQFIGVSSFTSPFFEFSGVSNAHLMLKNFVNTFSDLEVYTLHIMISADGTNWETIWEMLSPVDIEAEQLDFELSDEYLTAGQVMVKFHFEGDSYEMNNWNIDDIWVVEQIATSINENVLNNISIYPNPTSSNITIRNADNADVKIYNIAGQLMISEVKISSNYIVDLSTLRSGTYFIQIVKEGQLLVEKINVIK